MQQLPFETWTQLTALALTLVAGWLLGLASAPAGRKWRERYHDEEMEHATYRDRAEGQAREQGRRVKELEAEVARLKRDGGPAPVAAPAELGAGWRGWFGWGRDNLSRIRGIDGPREQRLNEFGIKTYREIEKMSADDEAAFEQRLGMDRGAIAAEAWREQAAMLRAGSEDEHAMKFG